MQPDQSLERGQRLFDSPRGEPDIREQAQGGGIIGAERKMLLAERLRLGQAPLPM
jgi:hypothetical protein